MAVSAFGKIATLTGFLGNSVLLFLCGYILVSKSYPEAILRKHLSALSIWAGLWASKLDYPCPWFRRENINATVPLYFWPFILVLLLRKGMSHRNDFILIIAWQSFMISLGTYLDIRRCSEHSVICTQNAFLTLQFALDQVLSKPHQRQWRHSCILEVVREWWLWQADGWRHSLVWWPVSVKTT